MTGRLDGRIALITGVGGGMGVAAAATAIRGVELMPQNAHPTAKDVVNAAVFLASDESSWISGTNLVVDGGASVLG